MDITKYRNKPEIILYLNAYLYDTIPHLYPGV